METENSSKIARRTEPGIGDDDRLSSLPDPVICHILSFMETKYAVATAVLSRRWEDLWTRVSSLDFDGRLVYRSLAKPQKLGPASDFVKRDMEFCRFVDKVLGQHENLNSLRRFRFRFPVDVSYLYKCRMRLSETGFRFRFTWESVFVPQIEEIDVMVGETGCRIPQCMHCIPQSFYTLKNLKAAKLDGVELGAIKESVFLPCVKILQLRGVKVENLKSLGRLLSGCPVVETVRLKNWLLLKYKENDRIEVSLPCLKNLKIGCFGYWKDPMHPIVIEAPNLEDLYLEQFADVQFKESIPLSCLHSAHVDLREESPSYVIRLLAQISNVKRMSLSGATLSELSAVDDIQLPGFPNLTHLTIGIEKSEGSTSWVVHSLLKSASKLQSLVIDMEDPMSVPTGMGWESLETACTPQCLLSSLEEIKIKELVAYPEVKKMIAYLLKVGAVLKKVHMHVCCALMDETDLMPLLELPRGSSACAVELLTSTLI